MITLLGSLLGFATSFAPKLLGVFSEGRDRAHELKVMEFQMRMMQAQGDTRMEEMRLAADAKDLEWSRRSEISGLQNASKWVVNLSATVRPVITYVFFIEFVALTVMLYLGGLSLEQYHAIWSLPMQGIWAGVISFWFGSRTFNRKDHS